MKSLAGNVSHEASSSHISLMIIVPNLINHVGPKILINCYQLWHLCAPNHHTKRQVVLIITHSVFQLSRRIFSSWTIAISSILFQLRRDPLQIQSSVRPTVNSPLPNNDNRPVYRLIILSYLTYHFNNADTIDSIFRVFFGLYLLTKFPIAFRCSALECIVSILFTSESYLI